MLLVGNYESVISPEGPQTPAVEGIVAYLRYPWVADSFGLVELTAVLRKVAQILVLQCPDSIRSSGSEVSAGLLMGMNFDY